MLHARIVEAPEALTGDGVTEQAERLAHHTLRGEVWDKAVTYGQQAGARAWDRTAFHEAAAAFEQAIQALALAGERGDSVLQVQVSYSLVPVYFALGDFGRAAVLRSATWRRRTGRLARSAPQCRAG